MLEQFVLLRLTLNMSPIKLASGASADAAPHVVRIRAEAVDPNGEWYEKQGAVKLTVSAGKFSSAGTKGKIEADCLLHLALVQLLKPRPVVGGSGEIVQLPVITVAFEVTEEGLTLRNNISIQNVGLAA